MANIFDSGWFNLELNHVNLEVSEHTVRNLVVYHIYFSDGRKPLSITKALKPEATNWISLPRGREQEAEEFGSAIREYLNKK
jgi:hypothetical protein